MKYKQNLIREIVKMLQARKLTREQIAEELDITLYLVQAVNEGTLPIADQKYLRTLVDIFPVVLIGHSDEEIEMMKEDIAFLRKVWERNERCVKAENKRTKMRLIKTPKEVTK